MALYPLLPGGYKKIGQAISYGPLRHCSPRRGETAVEGTQQRSARISVALSREDVIDAFPVAYPVEGV